MLMPNYRSSLGAVLLVIFMLASASGWAGEETLLGDFFIALRNGHVDEVKEWLAKGVEANACDERGETPLMLAARSDDYPKVVSALLDAGAKSYLRNPYGETALMLAAFYGRSNSVALLLERGTDIGEANRMGWTPLIYAAFAGHTAIVAQLLAYGAPADSASGNGMTALMVAARNGHIDTVRLLLAKGADRSLESGAGQTARQLALSAGNTDIAKELEP
jgi:uncharacterized protein